jgi:atypical dual specificity phosphatase
MERLWNMNIKGIPVNTERYLYMTSRPCYPCQSGCNEKDVHEYVSQLKPKGIKTIIVLLEDNEIKWYYNELDIIKFYRSKGFHVIHYPIADFSIPTNSETFLHLLESIEHYLNVGNVLMHCSAGKGRSGTVAASYLVYKGLKWSEAISLVRKVNPHSIESSQQEDFIRKLYGKILSKI